MKCAIYKGGRKADAYLYVERKDRFERVPRSLVEMLGRLELVLELDLSQRRSLARADVRVVEDQLRRRGYYLQMPPADGSVDSLSASC